MLSGLMRRPLLLLALPALAGVAVACGTEDLQLAKSDPDYRGAQLFTERCAGCHTLKIAGTQGSAVQANKRELKDGPNFDQREEKKEQVLYAIRNGGFSSGPMPQNIVVGEDADAVADFIAKYSGKDRKTPNAP
jgi:mono/diheme cytochrome c family protein